MPQTGRDSYNRLQAFMNREFLKNLVRFCKPSITYGAQIFIETMQLLVGLDLKQEIPFDPSLGWWSGLREHRPKTMRGFIYLMAQTMNRPVGFRSTAGLRWIGGIMLQEERPDRPSRASENIP
jgi:hypothetical protein